LGAQGALDNTETYEYDLNGNITKKTGGNSDTIEYGYDAGNRLTLRDYPNGGAYGTRMLPFTRE